MAGSRPTAFHRHMRSRMRAYARGTMHSSKARTGPVVRDWSQAVAISMAEARRKHLRGTPPAPRRTKGR